MLVECDPSLGLAASYVARHSPGVRVLWRLASSLEALRALARGEAYAAGIHLWEASTGVSNPGAVERELAGHKMHLLHPLSLGIGADGGAGQSAQHGGAAASAAARSEAHQPRGRGQ